MSEAKYRAVAEVFQRAIHTRNLNKTFTTQVTVTEIHTDNKPTMDMVQALGGIRRSKFIDIRHQYIKEQLLDNEVTIHHVPSEEQDADILSKPLGVRRKQRATRGSQSTGLASEGKCDGHARHSTKKGTAGALLEGVR